jgi:hypothetical protein
MNYIKRFDLHMSNGEQLLASFLVTFILNGVDFLLGGTFTILSFILTLSSQGFLTHILTSILYAFESKRTEKVKFFEVFPLLYKRIFKGGR